MEPKTRPRNARHGGAVALLVLGATLLGGCLGAPKLEDRWTRIDILNSSVKPLQSVAPGTTLPVTMRAQLTYRSIITGFAVAELRASSSLAPTDVAVEPDAPRLRMAQDIDRILQSSVSLGRATRAITGWDHLMQQIDFTFSGTVPAVLDTSGRPPSGVFLLCYLGSGQKVELPSGGDTIIVTPFVSSAYQLLPIGMELAVSGPRSH